MVISVTMTNNSLHFRVKSVSGDKNKVSFTCFFVNNFMNSRHKRTRCVKHTAALLLYLLIDIPADSVRTYHNCFIRSKLVNGTDYPRTFRLHIVYNVLIVDYRTKRRYLCILFKLTVDHLHCTVNTETKACGFCYRNLTHQSFPPQQHFQVHPQQDALCQPYSGS